MIIRTNKLTEGTEIKEQGDKFVLTKTVNINPILEANYHARKDQQDGWSKDRNMRRVASVPFEVWNEWIKNYPELILGDRSLRDTTLRKLLYKEEAKQFWTVDKGL